MVVIPVLIRSGLDDGQEETVRMKKKERKRLDTVKT